MSWFWKENHVKKIREGEIVLEAREIPKCNQEVRDAKQIL
jgi:hypothetical protein